MNSPNPQELPVLDQPHSQGRPHTHDKIHYSPNLRLAVHPTVKTEENEAVSCAGPNYHCTIQGHLHIHHSLAHLKVQYQDSR